MLLATRWSLGLVLIATLSAAFTGGSGSRSLQQQGSTDDPLTLFTRTVPVFQHDRCQNCHGATDPLVPRRHPRGVDSTMACSSCHVDENDWRLGPDFIGQTPKQLCEMMAGSARHLTPPMFLHHLENDRLILQSWTGLAGGARDILPATPAPLPTPRMTHAEFVEAAKAWLDDGLAMCDREGEIRYVERIQTIEGYSEGPQVSTRIQQGGTRSVTIKFANGRYSSNVQLQGSISIVKTITGTVNGRECRNVITSTTSYADVDDQQGEAFNLGINQRAQVQVQFGAGGKYTVTVHLGPERHRHMDGGSYLDGCGVPMPPGDNDNEVTEWPATSFRFEGRLVDPLDRRQLRGHSEKEVTTRVSPEDDPWFFDHYAATGNPGGMSLYPVKVSVDWNFRYHP